MDELLRVTAALQNPSQESVPARPNPLSLGPSSKVRAMALRSRGPRQVTGPNNDALRPRTAHAATATPAAEATSPGII